MTRIIRLFPLIAPLALIAAGAEAHEGHIEAAGLAAGFAHPFSGLDHLVAMLLVGLCVRSPRLLALAFAGCGAILLVHVEAFAAAFATATPAYATGFVTGSVALVAIGATLREVVVRVRGRVRAG